MAGRRTFRRPVAGPLSHNLLSSLTPYSEEIIGDLQCGFRRSRSNTDHIFCVHQILEKKWECKEVVFQLFIEYKKAYDSVRREVLLNILIEFGIHRKMVRLMKMCLTETYSGVWVGKHLSDMFPIMNIFKKGEATYPLLFIFALKYSIRRIQVKWRA